MEFSIRLFVKRHRKCIPHFGRLSRHSKNENTLHGKWGYCHMCGKKGFTLVELMVVVSIVAILAAVATPAYINYVNRTKQGQAVSMLLTARLEMEEFYTDNGRYASTIQCLPSFARASTSCLANCTGCVNSATVQYYTFWVSIPPASATSPYYQVAATRQIYAG